MTIPLRGVGLLPPVAHVTEEALAFEVSEAEEQSQFVTVRNEGLSDLTFSISAVAEAAGGEQSGTGDPYTWRDSDQPGGITFDWVGATGGTELRMGDDEVRGGIPLGFSLDFYGITVTRISVSSNGWLSVPPPQGSFLSGIPSEWDANAHGAIAAFATDLNPAAGGTIRYQTFGTAPDRYFVLHFQSVPLYWAPAQVHTFATILYERTNTIRFQYLNVPTLPGAFGIQSPDGAWGFGSSGVDDTYLNPARIRAGYAIEFSPALRWLRVEPGAGTVPAGDSVRVAVTASGAGITGGLYQGGLTITTNDPAQGSLYVPVSLNVRGVSTEGQPLPTRVALHPGFPNPFVSATTLSFDVPSVARARLSVYDMLGREVALLVGEEVPAGRHTVRWEANGLAAGAYLVRLEVGEQVETRRVVLVR